MIAGKNGQFRGKVRRVRIRGAVCSSEGSPERSLIDRAAFDELECERRGREEKGRQDDEDSDFHDPSLVKLNVKAIKKPGSLLYEVEPGSVENPIRDFA